MRLRAFFAIYVAAMGAVYLMGCATVRLPSCGIWRTRPSDGANCQECLGRDGRYTHCQSSGVLETK